MSNPYGGDGFTPVDPPNVPPPPFAPVPRPSHPTFLEWLSIGKLAIIMGGLAVIVMTVVDALCGG